MGFNSVYKVLQEVFPQVDSRVLKAVAIEHSKDADSAVEIVLVEIIPNLPAKPLAVGSSSNSMSSLSSFEGGGGSGQLESTVDQFINSYHHDQATETCVVSSNDESLPGATEALDTGLFAQVNSYIVTEPSLEPLVTSSYDDAIGGIVTERVPILLETFGDDSSINHDIDNHDKVGFENADNDTLFALVSSPIVGTSEPNVDAAHESDPGSSKSVSRKDDFAVDFVDSDDESHMSPVLTRSEEKCSTEFLEEIIEEAKNNKKTFELTMNSVVDLMREVESKEKAADRAKENATRGCSDIFSKVDEVKQALSRAKEANEMNSGEVNAEKAILATELKELQLRLFTLSEETNRSLGILDEMRKALEVRLAAAIEAIAAAEDEKIENERAVREELTFQERQMEKVVEESKKLKLEAEENSKLQEFLMDRGRAIDILQGEISVKCQDVLLLKEKFEKGIPLSRSLSSSQTSSILASSGSSFRSLATPREPEHDRVQETYEGLMKSGLEMADGYYGFVDKGTSSDVVPQSPISAEESAHPAYDGKVLVEDGWELFG